MLGHVHCVFCAKPSCDVEELIAVADAAICNECVGQFARKLGIISAGLDDDDEVIAERFPCTFVHRLELSGHMDQLYDMLLLHGLLYSLRAQHWDVAFEVKRMSRSDGFVRSDVAQGRARYAIELLVRTRMPVNELSLRTVLEDDWARLVAANVKLSASKGLRDLVEPRLASLASYLSVEAAKVRRGEHLD